MGSSTCCFDFLRTPRSLAFCIYFPSIMSEMKLERCLQSHYHPSLCYRILHTSYSPLIAKRFSPPSKQDMVGNYFQSISSFCPQRRVCLNRGKNTEGTFVVGQGAMHLFLSSLIMPVSQELHSKQIAHMSRSKISLI